MDATEVARLFAAGEITQREAWEALRFADPIAATCYITADDLDALLRAIAIPPGCWGAYVSQWFAEAFTTLLGQ